jgi:hypothetical protein
MIDDLEDGDNAVLAVEGRDGFWYSYNDGTAGATQSPSPSVDLAPEAIPGGRGTSTKAVHTTGSGFTDWGAGVGVGLNEDSSKPCVYDASVHTGIELWAKGDATVRMNVATIATADKTEGGSCSTSCDDHFGASLDLTSTWTKYTIAFTDLQQAGWGTVASFDAAKLLGLSWQVPGGVDFDFWIDDVTFYPAVEQPDGGGGAAGAAGASGASGTAGAGGASGASGASGAGGVGGASGASGAAGAGGAGGAAGAAGAAGAPAGAGGT